MDKVMHFFIHTLVIVPINTYKWQSVVDEHAKFYLETMHNISNLKRKFQALANTCRGTYGTSGIGTGFFR